MRVLALILTLFAFPAWAAGTATFTNPLTVAASPDPWIVQHRGSYYLTFTQGGRIDIWKSPTLSGFRQAPDKAKGMERVSAWRPGPEEPYRNHVWAPELQRVDGRWYLYYTATIREDDDHRIFVLQGQRDNPLGPYTVKHQIRFAEEDHWAIDPTVFKHKGKLYLLWTGWNNPKEKLQRLYIARMSNPWTVEGRRHLIAEPEYAWEKHRKDVNEGPELLKSPDGKRLFIVYSASFYNSPNYCLGMLTYAGGDLLKRSSWVKSPQPVFQRYHGPDGSVYGPGHNGFFKSPDGKEDWIVYHARATEEFPRGRDNRTSRAQPLRWRPDGTPDFGTPIPAGIPLPEPSRRAPRNQSLTAPSHGVRRLVAAPHSHLSIGAGRLRLTAGDFKSPDMPAKPLKPIGLSPSPS